MSPRVRASRSESEDDEERRFEEEESIVGDGPASHEFDSLILSLKKERKRKEEPSGDTARSRRTSSMIESLDQQIHHLVAQISIISQRLTFVEAEMREKLQKRCVIYLLHQLLLLIYCIT